jgi:hypothetical protein
METPRVTNHGDPAVDPHGRGRARHLVLRALLLMALLGASACILAPTVEYESTGAVYPRCADTVAAVPCHP